MARFIIPDMDMPASEARIRKAISSLDPEAQVEFEGDAVTVTSTAGIQAIHQALSESGHSAVPG